MRFEKEVDILTSLIEDLFTPFYSAAYTRSFLQQRLEANQISNAKARSYQNSYSFMYYLQHGQLYFEQAAAAPLAIKPVLLFYGLAQLIKACVLTTDPTYPGSSDVLAHGVSTRKRKKTAYQFLQDEVKIQQRGFFGYFIEQLFHVKHSVGTKYPMRILLKQIADLHDLFNRFESSPISFPGKQCSTDTAQFPETLLDAYHMTFNRFQQYMESHSQGGKPVISQTKKTIEINYQRVSSSPLLFSGSGTPYLLKDKDIHCYLPPVAVYYLILYNISMICRYETEWWGELLHTFDGSDLPFIMHFLKLTEQQVPTLIHSLLLEHP